MAMWIDFALLSCTFTEPLHRLSNATTTTICVPYNPRDPVHFNRPELKLADRRREPSYRKLDKHAKLRFR